MKIIKIETLHCDAGWRIWSFIKVSSDDGLVGYSECTDAYGSTRGIVGVVRDLETLLIGKDPREVEKIHWDMYSATRQSPGSVVDKAIGGIENALLDIKAKALGISVYELFGGPVRDTIPLYWSHCGTTRVRASHLAQVPKIESLNDITSLGEEVIKRGFQALKTNLILFDPLPRVYMPGFGKSKGGPELNINHELIEATAQYIAIWRKAVGDNIDIILDLNFNFKTEGYIRMARALDQFNLMWLEIDSYDPRSILAIRQAVKTPIGTGETLYSTRDFRPYFEERVMDIVSIDVSWNGFLQSKKIADMADLYEMNVAPHNHHSHLSTFMSANFAALIPNLRIMEIDVDDVSWKDELATNTPLIENGMMALPRAPGWGTDLNEEVLKLHPWNE